LPNNYLWEYGPRGAWRKRWKGGGQRAQFVCATAESKRGKTKRKSCKRGGKGEMQPLAETRGGDLEKKLASGGNGYYPGGDRGELKKVNRKGWDL